MENMSWKTIGAVIIIALLIFNGFIKDNSLLNKNEKEQLNRLEQKTKYNLSGRLLTAVVWFSFFILSCVLYLIFYKNN